MAGEEDKPYQDFLNVLRERWKPVKAAFFILEHNGVFRLRSQFGFTRSDRLAEKVSRMDALAMQVYEHREPFFVNNIRQAGKLAGLMENASTTKMMTAPLYLDGRIAGILDVRDKGGRLPFTPDDSNEVSELLRRFALEIRKLAELRGDAANPDDELRAMTSVQPAKPQERRPATRGAGDTSSFRTPSLTTSSFNTPAFNTASFRTEPAPVEGNSVAMRRGASPPEAIQDLPTGHLPNAVTRTLRLVEETLARAGSARAAAPAGSAPAGRELDFCRLYLQTCLQFPEVEVAAVSHFQPTELEVSMASRRPVDPDIEPALLENLEKIFVKSAVPFAIPKPQSFQPLDVPVTDSRPVKRAEIAAIQSSVLWAAPEGLSIFSILFRHGPTPEAREALRSVHVILKNALSEIRSEARYRESYRGLVNKLIEPGLLRRTALKTHSFNVGRMARKVATFLAMPSSEIEQITVAGILHDVGMRDLNYDELYGKRSLTEDELRLLKQHPRVGAFLLEDIPWPYPIAPLVKHHHERWDGAGYPDGLRAEQIPIGSRIIHLCEAFDAMTSPTSYRAVLSDYQALDILVSKAGTQFDPDLAPTFRRMVEGQAD